MRVKINFPQQAPLGVFKIPVRITDINYGGHLGNDALLSMLQEARVQWLASAGFTELKTGSHGLIMADVMIAYRNESFYGDELKIALILGDSSARSFDILYQVSTLRDGKSILIAEAKTGMVCMDYTQRKIVTMDEQLKTLLGL
ncbi:MAG: thioesterase family protein [Chitinophagaceae bacterium]